MPEPKTPHAATLARALLQLLPQQAEHTRAATPEAVSSSSGGVAATSSSSPLPPPPPPPPPACAPAQINLATLLLTHGQPLAALRLAAPVVTGAHGLPSGSAARAFAVAAEAQLALGRQEVQSPPFAHCAGAESQATLPSMHTSLHRVSSTSIVMSDRVGDPFMLSKRH